MQTVQEVVNNAVKALEDNEIDAAFNENGNTFLVKGADTDRAETILLETVTVHGLKVHASKGVKYSVLSLLVPFGTVEELALF